MKHLVLYITKSIKKQYFRGDKYEFIFLSLLKFQSKVEDHFHQKKSNGTLNFLTFISVHEILKRIHPPSRREKN